MDYIEIEGYKSIKKAHIDIKPINILIGANGAGKSNFVSFFEFLNNLYERKLQEYVGGNGGFEFFLFQGVKVTDRIKAYLSFNGGNKSGYEFELGKGTDAFYFKSEILHSIHFAPYDINRYRKEAEIKITGDKYEFDKLIRTYLTGLKKYHFHDTGKNSPFSQTSHIDNDGYFLYNTGSNLAAFLFDIQQNHQIVYNRIITIVQSIAPYFSDFYLRPNLEGYIRLQWQDKYGDTIYGATDLSDGTIRFIALTALFTQPDLPQTIIIDEPELGLHPIAIAKLAGMIQSAAAKGTQVIVATQSTDLVSYFKPEDIITVDQQDGASVFNRLNAEDLSQWLDDYTLGDLWKRNIIQGGQP
jgi:predicted ATPase